MTIQGFIIQLIKCLSLNQFFLLLTLLDIFLIPILEPLTHNEFTVKDPFSFTKEITKCNSFAKEITKHDSSLFMASLNVESLFTNIPLKETINNSLSDLHKKNL